MNKRFFQYLMSSIGCLMTLSSSPLLADVECANITSNSKGPMWLSFTYVSCKDGSQHTEHPDIHGKAQAFDAAVGTFLVSIGPVGTSTNYIEGKEELFPIKKGDNNVECQTLSWPQTCSIQNIPKKLSH